VSARTSSSTRRSPPHRPPHSHPPPPLRASERSTPRRRTTPASSPLPSSSPRFLFTTPSAPSTRHPTPSSLTKQNALNSLSLVVNLTKHIQVHSTPRGATPPPDAAALAPFLPSFLWVVRDFALQLMTPDGRSLTPTAYLDAALQPVQGSSDTANAKNKIRALLSSYFQNRDCFTLVPTPPPRRS
jgi:hypothetical protein